MSLLRPIGHQNPSGSCTLCVSENSTLLPGQWGKAGALSRLVGEGSDLGVRQHLSGPLLTSKRTYLIRREFITAPRGKLTTLATDDEYSDH